jgi:hypothetical protein
VRPRKAQKQTNKCKLWHCNAEAGQPSAVLVTWSRTEVSAGQCQSCMHKPSHRSRKLLLFISSSTRQIQHKAGMPVAHHIPWTGPHAPLFAAHSGHTNHTSTKGCFWPTCSMDPETPCMHVLHGGPRCSCADCSKQNPAPSLHQHACVLLVKRQCRLHHAVPAHDQQAPMQAPTYPHVSALVAAGTAGQVCLPALSRSCQVHVSNACGQGAKA